MLWQRKLRVFHFLYVYSLSCCNMEACTFTWTSQSDFKNKWLTNSLYSIQEKAMKITTDKVGIEPTYFHWWFILQMKGVYMRYVRGTLCFLPLVEWTPRCPDSKEGRVPCSGLNTGSYFIAQEEGMTESPVETLEKAIVLHLFWTEGLTSFWHIERCAEFIASKSDDAWLYVKIDRNTNIPVPTHKGRLASRLTFSSVRTVLPSLV